MREQKVSATTVLKLFNWDHIVLHALNGSDEWWNLDPKLVAPHKEKSRKDTGIVAKVRRIAPQWREFTRRMSQPDKGKPADKPQQKKESIRWHCPYCQYRVRSTNQRYVDIRKYQHLTKAHKDATDADSKR